MFAEHEPRGGALLAGAGPEAGVLIRDGLAALAHRGSASWVGTDAGVQVGGTGRFAAGATGANRVAAGWSAVGGVGVALAGGFVARDRHRNTFLAEGALLRSDGDAELLLHRIARSKQRTLVNRVVDALTDLDGGFAVAVCGEERMVVARDPRGIRPLYLGERLDGAWACSERGPLIELGVRTVREVGPGSLLVFDGRGPREIQPFPKREVHACTIEAEVLVAPTEEGAWEAREALGAGLAASSPCPDADLVLGLGEGAVASGFARQSKLPLGGGLLLTPNGYAVASAAVRGRRVVLVLAYLPSATSARRWVTALHESGAAAVHLRVGFPAVVGNCRYGVDVEGLRLSEAVGPDRVAHWLGVASVGMGNAPASGCQGCMVGRWPVSDEAADQLPLFTAPTP